MGLLLALNRFMSMLRESNGNRRKRKGNRGHSQSQRLEPSHGHGATEEKVSLGEPNVPVRSSPPLQVQCKKGTLAVSSMVTSVSGPSSDGLITASTFAEGNDSPCRNDDNSIGGEEVRYAGPDLPEEIWHHICSLVPMRDAARAACVSHVFLSSWGCHPNLTFTKQTMCSKEILGKWTWNSNDERYKREYNKNIGHILENHTGAGMKTVKLDFHGPSNAQSYHRLNSWLQIAITPVLEELALYMFSERLKYKFPCSLLSHGSGNMIRHLSLCNCVLRPKANVSLRCLKTLYLHNVRVTENELGRFLSNSSALESLILKHCEDIIRLEIPCQLQRFWFMEVFECPRLQLIENKAPNIAVFDFTGDEIQLSLRESLQLKNLTLERRCVINYAIENLASSVPNLETLNLWSACEIVDTPIITRKFLHLKVLRIHINNWSKGREYDFLSLVSFLDASPSLENFRLFVPVQSKYDCIVGDPSTLRQMPERHHDKLKTVWITGFCRQNSLVELTRHILESATSLKSLILTTIDVKHQFYGHNSFRKCPTMDKEYVRDVLESITAVKTYIEGKVPSTVKFEVYGPCSKCHAL